MRPLDVPLRFTQGDDARVRLTFRTDSGPYDLTDYTLSAALRARSDPALPALATFAITGDKSVGEVVLSLEEEVTLLLPPRSYWSFRAFLSPTDLWQTWLAGNVRVDFQAGDASPNDFTIQVGPQEIQVLVAANIGPPGPAGQDGEQGFQGVAGVGVPPGGTTGQILAKASNADYDTEWVDP